jgi:hypothetical protein
MTGLRMMDLWRVIDSREGTWLITAPDERPDAGSLRRTVAEVRSEVDAQLIVRAVNEAIRYRMLE